MKRRVFWVGLLGVLACTGDLPSTPGARIDIDATSVMVVPRRAVLVDGRQMVACDFRISVQANDFDAKAIASWAGGRIDYTLKSTGERQSVILSEDAEQEWFGSDRIAPGQSAATVRSLAWSGAFSATLFLNYVVVYRDVSSEDKTIVIPLDC